MSCGPFGHPFRILAGRMAVTGLVAGPEAGHAHLGSRLAVDLDQPSSLQPRSEVSFGHALVEIGLSVYATPREQLINECVEEPEAGGGEQGAALGQRPTPLIGEQVPQ